VIVLNIGEKFNPVTLENLIQSHFLLFGAFVTGTKRNRVALLIEAKDPNPDLVDMIWPLVEQEN
jgi:hypothetical protein